MERDVFCIYCFFLFLMFIAFYNNSNDRKEFRMQIIFQSLPALHLLCRNLFSLSVW